MEIEDFFVFSTLTARIFRTTGSSETLCTSSHFKGLISGKVELEAQGRDITFTFCHALLKKAILHYKIEFGQILLHRTVVAVH